MEKRKSEDLEGRNSAIERKRSCRIAEQQVMEFYKYL